MTRVAILLLLVGCGRLAFDGRDDASGDANGDAFDGAPGVASCPGMTTVFDEDGDLAGDPCDVCPHLVDDQSDGDSDGVGDACDFAPAAPRQRILFFDGFNAERPEWGYGGTVTGGQLVLPVVGADANNVLDVPTSLADVTLGGTILEVGAMPTHVFLGMKSMPTEQYYMELIDAGSGRRRSLMHYLDPTYTELAGVTEPGVPIQPGPFRVFLSTHMNQMYGSVETAGATESLLDVPAPTITSARMIVYVQNLSLVIDYAIVIETF